MKKYVILSVSNNPDYYSLAPVCAYSWRKLGYYPVILFTEGLPDSVKLYSDAEFLPIKSVNGVLDATVCQLSRLFAATMNFNSSDVLLTSDIDMVIAKDIFTHEGDIVSYGYDLTGRSEIPICYVKATAEKWRELMGQFTIPPKAYSDKWEDFWSVDQQLLTQRAHEYGMEKITFVNRGNQNKHGLPTGRWDRFDWNHIPDDIIDVHMKRNDWDAQIQVFQRLWPGEDYSFILKFKDELEAIAH